MPMPTTVPSIGRFARAMEIVLTWVLFLIPIGLGVYAFGFSAELTNHPLLTTLDATPEPLPLPWTIAVFAVMLTMSAPLLYATNAARLMFGGFRRGEVFTAMTATRIQQIALGLIGQALVEPIGGLALSAILSGAGHAEGLVLSISSSQLWIALFAFIFLGIARVMRAAALIAEDNAAIV